jgi:hypothetical protein
LARKIISRKRKEAYRFSQVLEDMKKRVTASKRSKRKDCGKKEKTENLFRDRILLLSSPWSFQTL